MRIKNIAIALVAAMLAAAPARAFDIRQVRFHNEVSDTTRVNAMLIDASAKKLATPGECISYLGKQFVGTPYVGHTLEGEPEMLTVNIDELDCTTFVETLIAMALTIDEGRNSWLDFLYNLQRIRYRSGEINGYPSRLHYNSDWALDNIHRGNFVDATPDFPRYTYMTKTLDFMSSNADKYAALADSANLARIKEVENGYRSCRFPYIKTVDLASKAAKAQLREGDIIGFVSNLKNLDVTHMGIIVKIDGEPHVMHASSSAGEVVISKLPLHEFMKKNRQFVGIRVFRIPQ